MSLIVNDKITIPILVLYIVIVIDIVFCIDIAFVIVIPHVPDCEQNSYNVEKYFFSPPKIRTGHLWNKFGKFDSISVDFLEVKKKIICVLISMHQPPSQHFLWMSDSVPITQVTHLCALELLLLTISDDYLDSECWEDCSEVALKGVQQSHL